MTTKLDLAVDKMTPKTAFSVAPILCLVLSVAPLAVQAFECVHDPAEGRPKIGLALGGGGARGYAHVGVLKRLQELQVPVDFVAGTSIGSIVAGMLASGLNADEIEIVASEIDWTALFSDSTTRAERTFRRKRDDDLALFGPKLGVGKGANLLPTGAIAGQKILFLFENIINERVQFRNFDELPIPFRAISGDIVTGREVVVDKGSVAVAMRASMSVPGIFRPVEYQGMQLVDGGIANNLPISVVKEMGAQIVIAIDVGSGLLRDEQLDSLISITAQMTNLLIMNNTRYQHSLLDEDDILIVPPLGDEVTSTDFEKIQEGMAIGYRTADEQTEVLARLGLSEAEYAEHRKYVESCVPGPPIIQWVELDNRTRFRDEVIQKRLNIKTGVPLDTRQLDEDIQHVYSLGFLSIARYEVRERDGKKGIFVQVLEDERGTNLVEYGLDLLGGSGSTDFNVRLGFLKTDIDKRGTELRVLGQLGSDSGIGVELYKPLTDDLRWIVRPLLSYENRDIGTFDDDGNKLSEVDVEQYGLEVAAGHEFGTHAALFAGVRSFSGDVSVGVGDPNTPDIDYDGGEWFIGAEYDRIDDRYFPSEGSTAHITYVVSSDFLGADNDDYEQIIFNAFKVWSWGKHSIQAAGRFKTTLDDNAPIYAQFRGGGFFRLSGFEENQVSGQHFGFLGTGYRYTLREGGLLPAYVGATIEYGNAAQKSGDVFDDGLTHGSVYIGFNSLLGPLYLGIGFGENADTALFLRSGNVSGISTIGR